MQPTMSHFQIYSIGIAAANKHLDSDLLQIVPIEITPFGEGELDSKIEEFEGEGKDRFNEDYHVKVSHDRAIEAKWLRIHHTNRRTSPDVRRGERIMVYRHSDSGEFYWDSMGMDDHLRRLETAIYSWSATPREDEDATAPEHSYSLEVCTHTKQVTFRTARDPEEGGGGDGEPFSYTFQFNTGEGAVILTDHVGNWIQLNSADTKITVMNKDGAYTHWDKVDINMYAPNEITMKAENRIFMECGSSTIEMTPSNITQISPRIDLNP